MFSKSKITDPIEPSRGPELDPGMPPRRLQADSPLVHDPSTRASHGSGHDATPSVIAQDLTVKGDLEAGGDLKIEGTVEGDIRSHLLTIGETALVRGEVVADDIVVNGRIIGRIRGAKVRLSSTARVEGDILHKNIAIESGAQFEGSVQRSDDPVSEAAGQRKLPRPGEQPEF